MDRIGQCFANLGQSEGYWLPSKLIRNEDSYTVAKAHKSPSGIQGKQKWLMTPPTELKTTLLKAKTGQLLLFW